MNDTFELITVNADNLDKQGFFCYMSKRKTPGYRQKHDWMAARLAEGLKLHMVHEIDGRTVGFIEYIPGEFAWRAVRAPGYLVIHCLWVVGKGKGKGYGARPASDLLGRRTRPGQTRCGDGRQRRRLAGKEGHLSEARLRGDRTGPALVPAIWPIASTMLLRSQPFQPIGKVARPASALG